MQDELNTLIHPNKIQWLFDCVALVETSEETISRIVKTSATAKIILIEPIVLSKEELMRNLENGKLSAQDLNLDYLDKYGSFVVRHEHTGINERKLPTEWIEKQLGGNILSLRGDLKVNLNHPDFQFMLISWNEGTCLGWIHSRISFDGIASRAPKMGPYFRGGGMKPRLCRTLVNLLYPLSGTVLDPFCGHGGILREIADLGSFGIGIEINKKLCRELLANNRHYGYDDAVAIIMGDSINSPFRINSYSQAITDPPYAIQTTTKGKDREDLLLNWLEKQNQGLKLVFTTPTNMLHSLPHHWDLDVDQEDFVHKSLTRRIRRVIHRGGQK